jgi:hypothetical protein
VRALENLLMDLGIFRIFVRSQLKGGFPGGRLYIEASYGKCVPEGLQQLHFCGTVQETAQIGTWVFIGREEAVRGYILNIDIVYTLILN